MALLAVLMSANLANHDDLCHNTEWLDCRHHAERPKYSNLASLPGRDLLASMTIYPNKQHCGSMSLYSYASVHKKVARRSKLA